MFFLWVMPTSERRHKSGQFWNFPSLNNVILTWLCTAHHARCYTGLQIWLNGTIKREKKKLHMVYSLIHPHQIEVHFEIHSEKWSQSLQQKEDIFSFPGMKGDTLVHGFIFTVMTKFAKSERVLVVLVLILWIDPFCFYWADCVVSSMFILTRSDIWYIVSQKNQSYKYNLTLNKLRFTISNWSEWNPGWPPMYPVKIFHINIA